jgi:chemotaxis signal transduction protein
MRWLSFRIFHQDAEKQGIRFAVRESQAVESIPFSGVVPVSGSVEALLGILNYRGKSVRAFDLGAAMGLGPGYLPQRVRLLMVRLTRTSLPMAIAVQPELEEVPGDAAGDLKVVDLRLLSRIRASPPAG